MWTISMGEGRDLTTRVWAAHWLPSGRYPVVLFSVDMLTPPQMCGERMIMLAARTAYDTAQQQLADLNADHPKY